MEIPNSFLIGCLIVAALIALVLWCLTGLPWWAIPLIALGLPWWAIPLIALGLPVLFVVVVLIALTALWMASGSH